MLVVPLMQMLVVQEQDISIGLFSPLAVSLWLHSIWSPTILLYVKSSLKNVERVDIVDNFEIIEGTFVEAQTVNVSSNIQVLQLCCCSFNTPWSSNVCDLMQSLPGRGQLKCTLQIRSVETPSTSHSEKHC